MLEAGDVLGTVCDSVLAELVVEATGISTPSQVVADWGPVNPAATARKQSARPGKGVAQLQDLHATQASDSEAGFVVVHVTADSPIPDDVVEPVSVEEAEAQAEAVVQGGVPGPGTLDRRSITRGRDTSARGKATRKVSADRRRGRSAERRTSNTGHKGEGPTHHSTSPKPSKGTTLGAPTTTLNHHSPKPKSYAQIYHLRKSQELPPGLLAKASSGHIDPELAVLLVELDREGATLGKGGGPPSGATTKASGGGKGGPGGAGKPGHSTSEGVITVSGGTLGSAPGENSGAGDLGSETQLLKALSTPPALTLSDAQLLALERKEAELQDQLKSEEVAHDLELAAREASMDRALIRGGHRLEELSKLEPIIELSPAAAAAEAAATGNPLPTLSPAAEAAAAEAAAAAKEGGSGGAGKSSNSKGATAAPEPLATLSPAAAELYAVHQRWQAEVEAEMQQGGDSKSGTSEPQQPPPAALQEGTAPRLTDSIGAAKLSVVGRVNSGDIDKRIAALDSPMASVKKIEPAAQAASGAGTGVPPGAVPQGVVPRLQPVGSTSASELGVELYMPSPEVTLRPQKGGPMGAAAPAVQGTTGGPVAPAAGQEGTGPPVSLTVVVPGKGGSFKAQPLAGAGAGGTVLPTPENGQYIGSPRISIDLPDSPSVFAMAAAKQQWASRQRQSQKQQALQDAAAAAAAKLASPPPAAPTPDGQGLLGSRDDGDGATQGGGDSGGNNEDEDEEQAFIAQRVQRSKHIADQLHRLHEESRRLQEQSRLLQARALEMQREVGLAPAPPLSDTSAPAAVQSTTSAVPAAASEQVSPAFVSGPGSGTQAVQPGGSVPPAVPHPPKEAVQAAPPPPSLISWAPGAQQQRKPGMYGKGPVSSSKSLGGPGGTSSKSSKLPGGAGAGALSPEDAPLKGKLNGVGSSGVDQSPSSNTATSSSPPPAIPTPPKAAINWGLPSKLPGPGNSTKGVSKTGGQSQTQGQPSLPITLPPPPLVHSVSSPSVAPTQAHRYSQQQQQLQQPQGQTSTDGATGAGGTAGEAGYTASMAGGPVLPPGQPLQQRQLQQQASMLSVGPYGSPGSPSKRPGSSTSTIEPLLPRWADQVASTETSPMGSPDPYSKLARGRYNSPLKTVPPPPRVGQAVQSESPGAQQAVPGAIQGQGSGTTSGGPSSAPPAASKPRRFLPEVKLPSSLTAPAAAIQAATGHPPGAGMNQAGLGSNSRVPGLGASAAGGSVMQGQQGSGVTWGPLPITHHTTFTGRVPPPGLMAVMQAQAGAMYGQGPPMQGAPPPFMMGMHVPPPMGQYSPMAMQQPQPQPLNPEYSNTSVGGAGHGYGNNSTGPASSKAAPGKGKTKSSSTAAVDEYGGGQQGAGSTVPYPAVHMGGMSVPPAAIMGAYPGSGHNTYTYGVSPLSGTLAIHQGPPMMYGAPFFGPPGGTMGPPMMVALQGPPLPLHNPVEGSHEGKAGGQGRGTKGTTGAHKHLHQHHQQGSGHHSNSHQNQQQQQQYMVAHMQYPLQQQYNPAGMGALMAPPMGPSGYGLGLLQRAEEVNTEQAAHLHHVEQSVVGRLARQQQQYKQDKGGPGGGKAKGKGHAGGGVDDRAFRF